MFTCEVQTSFIFSMQMLTAISFHNLHNPLKIKPKGNIFYKKTFRKR